MAEKPTNDVLKARAEAAELLGLGDNPERLCASDRLRVDLVVTLRAAIDHAAQSLVDGDGGSADLGRLISATESLIKLLPNRELPKPASSRVDPREIMLRTYLTMRERGALAGEGYDGLQRENERLSAEVAALKAAASPVEHSDIPMVVERVPAPAGGNVVPLPRSNPPAAPAAPQYDYDKERNWRDHVLPDGSISSRPMSSGKWWGPV
jgi:hypothetical protein